MPHFQDQMRLNKGTLGPIFAFQAGLRNDLLHKNYQVLAEDYILVAHSLVQMISALKDAAVPRDRSRALAKAETFNVAAFNLSTHYQCPKDIDCFTPEIMDFIGDFYKDTGNVLSALTVQKTGGANQMMLSCYPGKLYKDGWDAGYNANEEPIKAHFFAKLWQARFITEQQLYDSGIMLGTHGARIHSAKNAL